MNAYGAAIPVGAAAEPARALLDFLTAPAAKTTFKAYGLE